MNPADGEEITAQNGRYGPYVKCGSDSRSLDTEEQLLTITLDEALAVLAQPKQRRGQTAKPPLREMGADPVSGEAMVVKDGRFGPYVTDGETNASLRKSATVEELTVERASELLQMRRDSAPSTPRGRGSRAGAKAPAATTKKTVGAKKKAPKSPSPRSQRRSGPPGQCPRNSTS